MGARKFINLREPKASNVYAKQAAEAHFLVT
jgi:hypothetical protein